VGESSAAFVGIDIGEHRLNIIATFEGAFLFATDKGLRQLVIPAPFGHESIPDFDLFLIGASAILETPIEDFLVSASLNRPRADGLISDTQKIRDSLVETFSEIGMKFGVQFPRIEEADFVEHAAKVNNAADLVFW
jgi:hypothetical protein